MDIEGFKPLPETLTAQTRDQIECILVRMEGQPQAVRFVDGETGEAVLQVVDGLLLVEHREDSLANTLAITVNTASQANRLIAFSWDRRYSPVDYYDSLEVKSGVRSPELSVGWLTTVLQEL